MKDKREEQFPAGWHKSGSFREALNHAWKGIRITFGSERNLKVQLVVYVLAVIVAVLLQLSWLEIGVVLMAATLIVVLEMINTAVEHFSDLVEPTYHATVRRIKDITAGAVLIASIIAVIVGLLLFGPPLLLLVV